MLDLSDINYRHFLGVMERIDIEPLSGSHAESQFEEITTELQEPTMLVTGDRPQLLDGYTDSSPAISMPQLYIQSNSVNARHFLSEDPLIETVVAQEPDSKFRLWFREIRALIRDFAFAAATAIFIVAFVIQPVKVEGTSMLPRLHDGERIFVNKFIYQFDKIHRGDIVVFWYPKNPSQSFIKRVIGLPGDEIRITNGKLYINNQLQTEPYISAEYNSNPIPNKYWIVDDHHYFVMGDNRDASNDSRAWGLVPEKYIYGKAIFRYWPLASAGALD